MSRESIELSVIIPSFNKASVIQRTIAEIIQECKKLGIKYEIVVVIDGDTDKTSVVLSNLKHEQVRYYILDKNRGKGFALKYGVSKALSEKYFAFLDADLDISPSALYEAVQVLAGDPKLGMILGSKFHQMSKSNYSNFRKFQSKAYSLMVRILFDLGVSETQTGLKVGRMIFLNRVASDLITDGFAVDLELILRMKHVMCTFYEIPVELNQNSASTINLASAFSTLVETFKIYSLYNKNWGEKKSNAKL